MILQESAGLAVGDISALECDGEPSIPIHCFLNKIQVIYAFTAIREKRFNACSIAASKEA